MFSNNIIISLFLFVLISRLIIHFINNIDFIVSTNRSFDIFRIYKKFFSNPLTLLIKASLIKFYEPRSYKKAIMDLYRKIY